MRRSVPFLPNMVLHGLHGNAYYSGEILYMNWTHSLKTEKLLYLDAHYSGKSIPLKIPQRPLCENHLISSTQVCELNHKNHSYDEILLLIRLISFRRAVSALSSRSLLGVS